MSMFAFSRLSARFTVALAFAFAAGTVAHAASVSAPAEVEVGEEFQVTWTGPNGAGDFISLDPEGAPENKYGSYVYAREGSPLTLRAPGKPGMWNVRYHTGESRYPVLAQTAVKVNPTTVSLEAPATVGAGGTFSVTWSGPDGQGDFISVDGVGAIDREYGPWVYTKAGTPAQLKAPTEPGDYEVRYHLGLSGYPVVGTTPVRIGAVAATLDFPGRASAGDTIQVAWQGPDNKGDFISIDEVGAAENLYGKYVYTSQGNPLRVKAPETTGPHEVRYLTGQSYVTLASVAVDVAPGVAKGTLKVFLSAADTEGGAAAAESVGAVEVILDASGSMLQRLDGTRRIELARQALLELTGEALPAGVPFALRVFGHKEADSCRTDLEIPLGPLDRARTAATLRSVNAKNLAKTPIADSLRQVGKDLAGAQGERLVILVTDGEETCDGDPVEVIRQLKASGVDVRVNIVGFAIDELMVKEEFERWARLGGGRYFDATDGASLSGAVRGALATTFEVVRGGDVVESGSLGGAAVELEPGDYTVRVGGREVGTVTVAAKEETRFVVED